MEMNGMGDKLRSLRTSKKLSQKQVSERLGISVSALSEYELGTKSPSYKNLARLARLYHVSCDYLIGSGEFPALDVSGLTDEFPSSARAGEQNKGCSIKAAHLAGLSVF